MYRRRYRPRRPVRRGNTVDLADVAAHPAEPRRTDRIGPDGQLAEKTPESLHACCNRLAPDHVIYGRRADRVYGRRRHTCRSLGTEFATGGQTWKTAFTGCWRQG